MSRTKTHTRGDAIADMHSSIRNMLLMMIMMMPNSLLPHSQQEWAQTGGIVTPLVARMSMCGCEVRKQLL